MIGCMPNDLKKHIESQFSKNMTWENHSQFGWHIDHRIPLDSAKTLKDVHDLCHYTNLQPMWWDENLKKGSTILPDANKESEDSLPRL